jgi:hypothetical protein
MSALTSFGSVYLNAFSSAVANGEAAAFQAISNAGFNKNPGYGALVANITKSVDKLINCLQANNYM